MISEWTVYWITRVDDIRVMAFTVAIVAFVCLMFAAVGLQVEDQMPDGKRRAVKMFITVLLSVLVIMGCVYIFTPCSNDMVSIKVIPAITNSDTGMTRETVEAVLQQINDIKSGGQEQRRRRWSDNSLFDPPTRGSTDGCE